MISWRWSCGCRRATITRIIPLRKLVYAIEYGYVHDKVWECWLGHPVLPNTLSITLTLASYSHVLQDVHCGSSCFPCQALAMMPC